MIRRVSEYIISCDHPDCSDGYSHAFCVHTREDCERAALENGWKRCTYKRWICPRCAKRIDRQAAAQSEVAA